MKIGVGVQVSDNSMRTSRRWRSGGVARCFAEGMGLLTAAAGWRMSSWFGDTGVLLQKFTSVFRHVWLFVIWNEHISA